MRRLDVHLVQRDVEGAASIVCLRCEEVLCAAGENYKLHTLGERLPLTEAGPLVNDPSEFVDEEMEFRKFYCPGCGTLLETEVILADLPPIHDKQLV